DLNAPETLVGHLETLGDNLERYVNAANMAGFEGLALVCGHVNSNIRLYRDNPGLFAAPQWQALQDWVANVTDYLSHFNETGAGVAMLPQLGDAAWLLPIGMETAAAIMVRLQSTGNEASNGEPGVRKQTATADDITLALPEDVNQELLDILLQELPIQTQAFSTAIQSLHTGGSLADLDAAQRIAHNLKGAANTVGIKGIAQLTHYLEDVLVACAQQQQLPTSGLLDSLIAAADCLEAMSESLAEMAPPPDEAMVVLQNILDWANRIDSEGIEVVVSAATMSMTNIPPIPTHTDTAITQAEAEPSEKPQAAMVRIEAEQLDRLFRQAGENIIINTQANERLRRMKGHLQTMQEQFDLLRRLADELEQLVDLKDLSGNPAAASAAQHDALEMDQYNELHTASRRMVEAAFDARELSRDTGKELEEMGRLLEDQQRLATETQETVMATRLVPINSIFQRLQRSLRQTCRLTGKECDLEFTGDQMMVHGDTPNAMIDPIMHLLRNAVDHGIESGAERLALGKPAQGKITVDFERDGNHILVRVRDDGRGLDFAAIRAMAEQRGVIAPGQAASEDDLKQVILRPNFSTRTEATQTSGRGVGMDVVNYQVQAQGGTLALHSVPGQGLTVEMKIPLPLSRSHALLAQLGPYRVALANKGIRQILFAADGELVEADGGQQLHIDGNSYPAITLSRLLNLPEHHKPGQPYRSALLVQNGQQTTAVMLDAVTHGLDIVVKDFGFYIKKIPGFIGATILGDGLVAPVLDIPELLLMADGTDAYAAYFDHAELLPQAPLLPTVLVVDDSLSQRRALEQLLHDAGFQVTTARDGIEAAEQLDTFTPDIVLTDLEMP
ncbi:MAG: ATP-binding protein, partial [Methylovulum sp.]|nr:ATP-binding protein [Methylovulum sp.]